MKRWIERGAFLLAAAATVIAAAAIPTRRAQEDTLPEVYVYRGYAAATDAPWSEKSLDFAAKRLGHLLETYFTGEGYRRYLAVVPDKAQFTEPPEGYTPAGAQETADYLAQRLPVEEIGIAPLLSLEDYYRTDPHWRQERLHPVAQALADAMGVSLPDTAEESLHTLAGEFHGSYWGKTVEPLAADVLSYITSPLLDGCAVYDYETDSTGGVYDLTAAEKAPYDLFLSGSKALLRIENPAAGNDRTLIVFRDSFGSSLIPLLAQGYGTVYAVDIRYLATDALARVVTFPEEADVLLVYSATVLQNSVTLK